MVILILFISSVNKQHCLPARTWPTLPTCWTKATRTCCSRRRADIVDTHLSSQLLVACSQVKPNVGNQPPTSEHNKHLSQCPIRIFKCPFGPSPYKRFSKLDCMNYKMILQCSLPTYVVNTVLLYHC